MKVFNRVGSFLKRAVAYQSLKDETLAIKGAADTFKDNLKEIKKNQSNSDETQKKQFSDLDGEEVLKSYKTYSRLVALFMILTALGVIYVIYALALYHYHVAFMALCFTLICGILLFRFHFFLAVLKAKKLNLSFSEYISLFWAQKKNKTL